MAITRRKSGYGQTVITKAQACGLSPESKAMKDSPAIASQSKSEATASACETISLKRPLAISCFNYRIPLSGKSPSLQGHT
jgi:hypothetical protein